ncbi:IQ calmodulin-binding motif-containing protein 1 [Xenentodon cancila]
MELLEDGEEAFLSELKVQLEGEELQPQQKMELLNDRLNGVLTAAAVQTDCGALARTKSRLYQSGVLSHAVAALSLPPSRLRGSWSAAATLAHLTSSCCVGVDPQSEAFRSLFLPSVMERLLSLACQLMIPVECGPAFRKVMDSVGWLLSAHPQLTAQVLSSAHYEQIQMCENVAVSLLCIQMWIQTCTISRDFLSGLSDDSALLLLNEAVGQLAVCSDSAVGGASIRLMLLMSGQLGLRLWSLLFHFRGLDRLLDKDWRGRGFDHDVDRLIAYVRSEQDTRSRPEDATERVRAACVIQAAWRSYQTRRRVKSLDRAVTALQRSFRARRRRRQQQKEAQRWEEELRYQVCVRRQRARRAFHQKQRRLLQQLPPEQVRSYLQECERRAAVVIQSFWRGFKERRHYETLRHTLRQSHTQQQAARTLQRAVRRFLERRQAEKATPLDLPWIGQKGLTGRRRAELQQQVEEYIAVHRSSRLSPEECVSLHQEVQLLLQAELQRGAQRRREEQRLEAVLAHTHTQLELLRDAPPLSAVTTTEAESYLSPSGSIAAQARDAHNAALQADRLPWWRTLGEPDVFSSTHLQELEAELGNLQRASLLHHSSVMRRRRRRRRGPPRLLKLQLSWRHLCVTPASRQRHASVTPASRLRHVCVTSASCLHHACGTLVARLRHVCDTPASRQRHACVTSASRLRHACVTSASRLRHVCGTSAARLRHASVMSASRLRHASVTSVTRLRHASVTSATRLRHACVKSATRQRHVCDTLASRQRHVCDTLASRLRHVCVTPASRLRHVCVTSATRQRHAGVTSATRQRHAGVTSATGLRHVCVTSATRLRHVCDTSASRLRHVCDTSATRLRHACVTPASRQRHVCDTSATRQRHVCVTPASRLVLQ